jgi:hypothetical protein
MSHAQHYESKIRHLLTHVQEVRLPDNYPLLQVWQSNRLMQTHQVMYQVKRFRPAIHFFRDDLYGAQHFRERNQQLMNALPIMCNTLPESMLKVVEMAAELHVISLELDSLLLHFLPVDCELEKLTLSQWVGAYQRCDNPEQRARQIELIENIGESLNTIVDKPLIGRLLKWAAMPATIAGYGKIHQFVCDGFFAFKALETPNEFLTPVIKTERALSERWFKGEEIVTL